MCVLEQVAVEELRVEAKVASAANSGRFPVQEWKAIPKWEGMYEVSNDGKVRSVDRIIHNKRRRWHPGKELKPVWQGGYLRVMLRNGNTGEYRTYSVHRLMARAFLPPPGPDEDRVRHLNDDPSDNRIENLAWGNASSNGLDAVANGRHYGAAKTRCKRGHVFSHVNKEGHRMCRTCKNDLARALRRTVKH